MPDAQVERSHNDLWDRIGNLEVDVTSLTERLDATREVVLSNQDEFKQRITAIEQTGQKNTILITRIDEKITTGSKAITWMFMAGIAAMTLGLGIIGWLSKAAFISATGG